MKRNFTVILLAVAVFGSVSWGAAYFLRGGLMRQYGLDRDVDMLILGHSHIMLALDAELMQNELHLRIAKYTREGVTVAERKLMAEHYLRLRPEAPLQCVFYGVDPYLFTSSGLSRNSYLNFLPFMDDAQIDEYIRDNAPKDVYWRNKLLPLCRFSDVALNAGISGYVKRGGASFKTGKVDLGKVRKEIAERKFRHIKINEAAVQCFRETVELFAARNVKVILLNTPIIDLYNREEAELHREVEAIYRDMAQSSPLVEYWDFNPDYETRYELFRDPIHLNRDGQRAVTNALIMRIREANGR